MFISASVFLQKCDTKQWQTKQGGSQIKPDITLTHFPHIQGCPSRVWSLFS